MDYPKLLRQKQARLSRNLITFGRVLFPEMAYKPSPPFHYDLATYLQDLDRTRINLVAPRKHAKSSIVACVYVLWHVHLEHYWRAEIGLSTSLDRREKFVVLISKTQGEAIRRLQTLKNIYGDSGTGKQSKRFRQIFGNWSEDTASKWTNSEIRLKDGTVITCVGMGQQVRGLKEGHVRPTSIVVDDPEDEENTKTESRMRSNKAWLLQGVLPSLDEDLGRCVVIGTPQNTECLVVKLNSAVGWTSRWYGHDLRTRTHWFDVDENGDPIDPREGLLWPDHIDAEKLEEELGMARSLGMTPSYYREWEAKIMGDEDQIFKPEYFRDTWQGELKRDAANRSYLYITHRKGQRLSEPEVVGVNVFTGIDPAASVSDRADKSVIFNIAVDKKGQIYWLPSSSAFRAHPHEVVDRAAHNHKLVRPAQGVAEATASQVYVLDYLQKDHQIYYQDYKPTDPKKDGPKARLKGLQPIFAGGRVHPHPEMEEAIRQFLNFPRGKDDWIDGFNMSYLIAYPASHEPILDTTNEERRPFGPPRYFDPMTC